MNNKTPQRFPPKKVDWIQGRNFSLKIANRNVFAERKKAASSERRTLPFERESLKTLCPIVILVSGNGSNVQAIIDAHLPIEIRAVISDNPNAYGLQRAKTSGITTEIINYQSFLSRSDFDQALGDCIAKYQPKLIVLAGFMRILGKDIIKRFAGKIINLHPSLLPKYPGLNTHARVIANKDKVHGVTVHYVTEELDAGPIIAQDTINVTPDDTQDTLKMKIQILEHRLLPQVIQQLASGGSRQRR